MLLRIFIISVLIFFHNLAFSQLPDWIEQTSGTIQTLTSANSNSTDVNNPSYAWVCGYGGTVLRTLNDGTNWQSVGGNGIPAATQLVNIVSLSENAALTAGYVGANTFVYRTSNAGANWTQVFTENNGFINAICFQQNSLTGFMTGDPVGGRWSLWKSNDGGITWDSAGMYLPQTGADAGWNNSLWCNIMNNSLWFGTNNTRIYHSSNFGANWTAQATTGSVNSYAVWFYSITGGSEGLTGGSEMYRTSNSGSNWILQPSAGTGNFGGITGGPNVIGDVLSFIYTFAVRGSNIIYTSTNDGTNWYAQHTAPAGTYRYIGSIWAGNKFWAVRNNGGISFLTFHVGAVNTISNEVPDKFNLSQNYPNPFNPLTKIKFQILKNSYVKLTVYDQLGRDIKTLVRERLQSGTYETEFTGTDLVSGIYFYKLESDNFSEVKKMILLK